MFGGDGTGEEISKSNAENGSVAFSKNRTIIELRATGLSPLKMDGCFGVWVRRGLDVRIIVDETDKTFAHI